VRFAPLYEPGRSWGQVWPENDRKRTTTKKMFLLPANTPHSPARGANTIGLVIERVRKGTDLQDGLMWFCEKCNTHLHTYRFPLENIEKDFIPRFKEFYSSEAMRTCKSCGHVMATDPRFT
jgi:3-hydroxyanthranilate 3,4-dioxygenase